MLKVSEVIPSLELKAIYPETSIVEAARTMNDAEIGALAVINPYGQLIGIVTERDLLRYALVFGKDPSSTTVEEIMTRDVEVIDKDASTLQAMEKMTRRGCRHLPVMDGEQVIAMLSAKDLLRAELRHREQVMTDAIRVISQESDLKVTILWQCQNCGNRRYSMYHPQACSRCKSVNSFSLLDLTVDDSRENS